MRAHWPPHVDQRVRAPRARPGRSHARHRQARDSRGCARKTLPARRIRMDPHADPPGDGTQPARPRRPVQPRGAGSALPPRAARWKRLPLRPQGRGIPIEARIVAVADTFDALTSDRPYRKACSPAAARRVLVEEAGSRLDPNAVSALFSALEHDVAGTDRLRRVALAF